MGDYFLNQHDDRGNSSRLFAAEHPCYCSGRGIFCYLAMYLLFVLFFIGCDGEKYKAEDFTASKASMDSAIFDRDNQLCTKEKDKHLNKIQGREFGFKGSETGYLGCMKMRGWDKKNPS